MRYINSRVRKFFVFPNSLDFSIDRLSRPHAALGGRNSTGRITTYHRGGGFKMRSRMVNFSRLFTKPAILRAIEPDPLRTAKLGVVSYGTGAVSYFLLPENAAIGSILFSGPLAPCLYGSHLPLLFVPPGANVFLVKFISPCTSFFSRAAGSASRLLTKFASYALLKLPSGEHRIVPFTFSATMGVPSNSEHFEHPDTKAGETRQKGRRPRSRGVATNPVDHPHGGRTQRGRPSRSFAFSSPRHFRTSSERGFPWILKSRRVLKSTKSSNTSCEIIFVKIYSILNLPMRSLWKSCFFSPNLFRTFNKIKLSKKKRFRVSPKVFFRGAYTPGFLAGNRIKLHTGKQTVLVRVRMEMLKKMVGEFFVFKKLGSTIHTQKKKKTK